MRKFFLWLFIVVFALFCSFAQAEGAADASLLTLGLHGEPLSAGDVPETLSQISSAVAGVNLVTSRVALVQEQALEPLYRMMRAAQKAGVPLYVRQAYRSYEDEARRYELLTAAGQAAQKPGESSYQTGLSVTLVGEDWKSGDLTEAFAGSKAAQWLSEHAADYGFVLRYPKGKEDITGWSYEPWHYRYVGVAAAAEMTQRGLCLEELAKDSSLISELGDEPLPEDVPDAEIEKIRDDDEVEAQPKRVSEHGVPTVRDTSAMAPEDLGPDGDYEISLDDL